MAVMVVRLSESLRPQQSVGEVDHEPCGHEGGERIVEGHGESPRERRSVPGPGPEGPADRRGKRRQIASEPVAGDGVAHREGEEAKANDEHDGIQHLHAPCMEWTKSLTY